MVNNVLFACLAAVIWNNLKEAALRGVLPSSSGPLVVVIVYLHRVAVPLQQFLLGVFKRPTLWDLGQGLAAYKDVPVEYLVKVMVLDSVRGITADYVHVIRGERHNYDVMHQVERARIAALEKEQKKKQKKKDKRVERERERG
jgi:hypothetical protein